MDLEAAGIQGPSQTPNDPAFACRVPSFEHDHGALRRSQIGLLQQLQRMLHRFQAPFVISDCDLRKVRDRGQPGRPENDEVFGLQFSLWDGHMGC